MDVNKFVPREMTAKTLMADDWFILFDNLYRITSVLPAGKNRSVTALLINTETNLPTRSYVTISLDNDHKITIYNQK